MSRSAERRPPTPEALVQAQRNLAIARRRRELEGPITAEISADEPRGELAWYALMVTPARERLAAAHLAARRFGIYLPTLRDVVIVRGRRHLEQRLIFPGYVFVCSIGLVGRWRRALTCPGVTAFLNLAGTDAPAVLPAKFIYEVRAYAEAENARVEWLYDHMAASPVKKRSRKARRSHKLRRAERRATVRLP